MSEITEKMRELAEAKMCIEHKAYSTKASCRNCGWHGKVFEKRGVVINWDAKPCPNCECAKMWPHVKGDE